MLKIIFFVTISCLNKFYPRKKTKPPPSIASFRIFQGRTMPLLFRIIIAFVSPHTTPKNCQPSFHLPLQFGYNNSLTKYSCRNPLYSYILYIYTYMYLKKLYVCMIWQARWRRQFILPKAFFYTFQNKIIHFICLMPFHWCWMWVWMYYSSIWFGVCIPNIHEIRLRIYYIKC